MCFTWDNYKNLADVRKSNMIPEENGPVDPGRRLSVDEAQGQQPRGWPRASAGYAPWVLGTAICKLTKSRMLARFITDLGRFGGWESSWDTSVRIF
jgi:hypothetical protein